jgi:hypothetical protein
MSRKGYFPIDESKHEMNIINKIINILYFQHNENAKKVKKHNHFNSFFTHFIIFSFSILIRRNYKQYPIFQPPLYYLCPQQFSIPDLNIWGVYHLPLTTPPSTLGTDCPTSGGLSFSGALTCPNTIITLLQCESILWETHDNMSYCFCL